MTGFGLSGGEKRIARWRSGEEPVERAGRLLQLLRLFGGRKLALESEQGVFQTEHEFFTLVLLAFVDALNVERLLPHRFHKFFDAAPKRIKFLPVLLDLMSQEKELVDVFKEWLQHDGECRGFP